MVKRLWRYFEVFLVLALMVVGGVRYYLDRQTQPFAAMEDGGYMRVLIADEPDSVYTLNKQPFGFEYELLKRFADQYDIELKLKIVPFAEIFALLESGAGDIAVGGIIKNPYVERVSQPTVEWYQAETTVVYRRGTSRPLNIDQLQGENVLASARYYQLDDFEQLRLKDDYRSEYELLNAVASGKERFAISINYRARNAKYYLPELSRSFVLPNKVDLVWALPKRHDVAFLDAINNFLLNAIEEGLPQQLVDRHFGLPKQLSTYDTLYFHRKIQNTLPKYEYAFRKAARRVGIDWTLLAGLSFQESKWSNKAVSPTGVIGIMQMTKTTADSLGVEDRLNTTESINAAADYLVSLRKRLPENIKEPERTWFALGAYNLGFLHVLRAHRLAEQKGLDSSSWKVVSKLIPQLYQREFPAGKQVRKYVERVQKYTDILRFYDLHQRDEIFLAPEITRTNSA